MAHELSFKDGNAEMFSGSGITPWHKYGNVVQGLLKADEALKAAGLDWDVVKKPILCEGKEIPGHFATYREDTQKVLGIVKGRYNIIQNRESFDFFDKVVGEGQAVYDTAGALFNGQKIWIMAKLNRQLFIDSNPKDVTDCYVLLSKGHDGLNSIIMTVVSVRVVCFNTHQAALRTAKNTIKIRHTKNYGDKLDQAQKALKLVNGYYDDLQSVMNELAKQKVSVKSAKSFTERLLPEQKVGNILVKHEAAREEIVRLFKEGRGNAGETKWDLLNGVTEFVDHKRRAKTMRGMGPDENRFISSMFGSGVAIKQRAMSLLLKN